ncbi:MAG: AraC family transcriptional regulator [Bacteroidota bacterium]
MKTRIYTSDLNEMLVEADYTSWQEEKSEPITERTFSAEIFLGSGSFKEVFYEGVHIGHANISLYNDTILGFERDFEVVKLVFSMGGSMTTESKYFNKTIAMAPGTHNLYYSHYFKGLTEWSCHAAIRTFEINLTPTFFNRLKLIDNPFFHQFRKAMREKKPAMLSKSDMPITVKMSRIIQEMNSCERLGIFKRMYMESQVITLLLLQMEQYCDIHKNTLPKGVSKKNKDKMYQVKELLETDFRQTDTLVDLAKKVGTNEFTLKTCFKELFGVSVFQYWKGLRLEAAKSMLLDERLSVQEVSNRVGYKNPQHFTTAFKKQFGVVPSQARS